MSHHYLTVGRLQNGRLPRSVPCFELRALRRVYALGSFAAYSLAFATSITRAGTVPDVRQKESDQIEAQLTVMALRSSIELPPVLFSYKWQLQNGTEAVDEAELIRQLVLAKKPLQCEAVVAGGNIIVRFPTLQYHRYRFMTAGLQEFVRRATEGLESKSGIMVVVRGAGSELVVPLAVYRSWQTNYFVDRSAHHYSFEPPEDLRQKGIAAIVDLRSSFSLRIRAIDSTEF